MMMKNETGSIELILGPMFSGKSTELQRRLRRHMIAKRKCVAVKYRHDTRSAANEIATHDLRLTEAVPCERIAEIAPMLGEYSVIGIDEGQFFPDVLRS